ncbi:hypothetical protein C8Q77DRAFT_411967 [Trametes polyzona]|nr:hypothetical protein C8Q77DRAFT_411967 [Trametes polyzona]
MIALAALLFSFAVAPGYTVFIPRGGVSMTRCPGARRTSNSTVNVGGQVVEYETYSCDVSPRNMSVPTQEVTTSPLTSCPVTSDPINICGQPLLSHA